MIHSRLGHLVLHVTQNNLSFYKELMIFLGWPVMYDDPQVFAAGDHNKISLWFECAPKTVSNDYDGPGMNHLGFSVDSIIDVDKTVAWLRERGIPPLFETPRHRPEFSSPGNTYYQVMFESPDRVLFEVVYTGPMP